MTFRETPLKRLFGRVVGGSWGSEPEDGEVTMSCVRAADFDYEHLRVNTHTAPLRGYSVVEAEQRQAMAGDIILEKSGGGEQTPVGRAVLWTTDRPVVPTNFAARLRPASGVDAAYACFLLASLYTAGWTRATMKQTTGIQNLDTGAFLSRRISLPTLKEQRAIADHLDTETARIDALITKKRRMVRLLDEREVSLAHAVVTGAPIVGERRDSGAAWLETIPASWPMVSVSSQFVVQLGRMLNPERANSGRLRPYIRNGNVRWDLVDTSDLAEMDFPLEDGNRYLLRSGDLLVNEGGAGIGRAAIWHRELDECYFQKSVHRLRPIGWTDPRWLLQWFRVVADRKVFLVEGNLATIPHIPAESLRVFRFPCPPRTVQESLLGWAEEQRSLVAGIRQRIVDQLQLLAEHRQALITAAVTGEIDVPGAVA